MPTTHATRSSSTSSQRRRRRRWALAVGIAACVAPLAAPTMTASAEPAGPFWTERTEGLSTVGAYQPIAGRFDSDQVDDILWYSSNGTDRMWRRGIDGSLTSSVASPQRDGDAIAVVGRFSGGDQLDDILWYVPGPGPDALWTSNGDGTFDRVGMTIDGRYQPKVLEAPDGSDILWVQPGATSHPVWRFRQTSGTFQDGRVTSPPGSVAVIGDFDGSGADDVFWYGAGSIGDAVSGNVGVVAAAPAIPQVVSGSYQPLVVHLKGSDSVTRDDILWFRRDRPTMSLWEGAGLGTWKRTTRDLPTSSTVRPIVLDAGSTQVIQLWDPAGPDRLALLTAEGTRAIRLDNFQPGSAYVPIVLRYRRDLVTSFDLSILWYQPGSAPEVLFTLPF